MLRRLYFHEQARAGLRVNRRERLVKQDDRRVTRQGARQSDSLALAPRHFARILSRGVLDAEERQQFTRPLAFGRFTQAAAVFSGSYSVGDVLLRREMRKEQIILEHEADMPLLDRQIDAGSRIEVDTLVERDAPFIGRDDSGDGAQTRRLPRTGRAKENRHAARRRELDVESEWLTYLAFIGSAWRLAFSPESYPPRSDLFSDGHLQHACSLHLLRPAACQLVRQVNGGDRYSG